MKLTNKFISSLTLHVSGIFCAHHQELSAVRTAIGTFQAGYVAASLQSQAGTAMQFQTDSDGHITCMKRTNCRAYIR